MDLLLGNQGSSCFCSVGSTSNVSHKRSTLVDGVWGGHLLHLAGLDVIGSTAGSLSRILQDREIELWESKRIVGSATPEEVRHDEILLTFLFSLLSLGTQIKTGELSVAHRSFRVISTASKSIPLKDWLSDEHANMFFPVPQSANGRCRRGERPACYGMPERAR